jgi:cell division protein ZapD
MNRCGHNDMDSVITYEQPLTEIIRVCLRLEQLFQQIDYQLQDTSLFGTRHMIMLINQLLQLLDRPDLKAKLAKEMSYHLASPARLHTLELTTLAQPLEELSRCFIDSSGKIGQHLRDIELFNTLRLHLATPGGGSSFDTPIYHYWLQQPTLFRQMTIQNWMAEFAQVKTAILSILRLVRHNAKIEQKVAIHGFYQELLDPHSNLRMVGINVLPTIPAYPEMSIGRHFLSVRFFIPNIEKRATQYDENLPFTLAYCNV